MTANQRFDIILQEKIDARIASGLSRELVTVGNRIDFSSNDYLGFSKLPSLQSVEVNTQPTGATGSRLVTGNSELAENTEKMIAQFHGAEAALIFNAGYMANVGLFSCIAAKGDTIISDELIHASIIDGIRLNHANRYKFKHNDVNDLEKKMQQSTGQIFVAVESIYSMDGDEAPLIAINELCKKYNALLLVDEAHAIGVFGDKGDGLVCKYNLQKDVYATVYTFGKAIGLHGAVVTGSSVLRNYLINNARSFIFATALPPHTFLQIQQAYNLLPTADRQQLFELIKHFRNTVGKTSGLRFIDSLSPIQGIIVGDSFKTKVLSYHLRDKGFFVKAILPPTVPVGTERLRISLHTFNTNKEIDMLVDEIKNFKA